MGLLRSGLDTQTKAELAELTGAKVHPLASGRSSAGAVVGLEDRLLYRNEVGWSELAWHEVERGNWDRDTQRLTWITVDGSTGELELSTPSRLPQLFKERVNASIACAESVELSGSGTAVINARRNLADPDGPLIWRVSPGKSTSATDVAADPAVMAELERLRTEYGHG